jgi:uncharacterized membrane protein
MIFGIFLLQENISPLRMIGTLLIACGCVLVSRS